MGSVSLFPDSKIRLLLCNEMPMKRPPNPTTKTINPYLRASVQLSTFRLSLELAGPDKFNLQYKVNSHRTTRYENNHFLSTFYKEYNDACMPTLFVKFSMPTTAWADIGRGNFTQEKNVFFSVFVFWYVFLFNLNKAPRILFFLNRVRGKITYFVLKQSKGFGKLTAHPHTIALKVPPSLDLYRRLDQIKLKRVHFQRNASSEFVTHNNKYFVFKPVLNDSHLKLQAEVKTKSEIRQFIVTFISVSKSCKLVSYTTCLGIYFQ